MAIGSAWSPNASATRAKTWASVTQLIHRTARAVMRGRHLAQISLLVLLLGLAGGCITDGRDEPYNGEQWRRLVAAEGVLATNGFARTEILKPCWEGRTTTRSDPTFMSVDLTRDPPKNLRVSLKAIDAALQRQGWPPATLEDPPRNWRDGAKIILFTKAESGLIVSVEADFASEESVKATLTGSVAGPSRC